MKKIVLRMGYISLVFALMFIGCPEPVINPVIEMVAIPIISPNGSEFVTSQQVTLTCATADATIRYTLDDSEPKASSLLYSAPFAVSATTTVKAIAMKVGYTNSVIATAEFTKVMIPMLDIPTISPNGGEFSGTQDVMLTLPSTEDVAIYYTIDGNDPVVDGPTTTEYTAAFAITETTTVKAIGVKVDYANSPIATAEFTKLAVATPSINPNGGNFVTNRQVTLTSATAESTIYYTLDSSDPGSADSPRTEYTGPFAITETTTVKAVGIKAGYTNSVIVTATFTAVSALPVVMVAGGTFSMGSLAETINSDDDERPVREVILSSFWMSPTEVTQKQYLDLMKNWPTSTTPSDTYGVGDDFPAYYVSWFDALEFCNALSVQENLEECYIITKTGSDIDQLNWSATYNPTKNGYHLPTEAQWEYAAKGGIHKSTFIYSGSDTLTEVAWFAENSEGKTNAVRTKTANALGLFDMSGNLWEWCWDRYADSYTDLSNDEPVGSLIGNTRILRGGGFTSGAAASARVANRDGLDAPYISNYFIGFRVARLSK